MPVPYRIGIPVQTGKGLGAGVKLPNIFRRDDENGPSGANLPLILGIVAAAIVATIIGACYWRRSRSQSSKPFGKKGGYHQTGDVEGSAMTTRNVPPNFDAAISAANQNQSNVNRNISIRSIMTLPAYRNKPDENEQVLGREGDRGGVDVVLEHPTDREEEDLREEEMETLYQIRLARRAEIAEREERRRLRRDARARGDTVALAELSQRTRAASNSSVISDLRAEHDRLKTQRQRAVSSVSYADLGVARHDGTRLRANSTESERVGLLSDAASVALSVNSPSLSTHNRHRSASSVLSWDSNQDLDIPQNSPGMTRSGATTPQRLSAHYSGTRSRAGSSPELIDEADLADVEIPQHDPRDTTTSATPVFFNEPPPEYSMGPTSERDRRLDEQVADMVDRVGEGGDLSERRLSSVEPSSNTNRSSVRSTRGVGGVPQLPSLRIRDLPQIVVEPSSAHPGRE
ncbi:growth arrest and DNA-damage-inducible proteins-interacting protein 1 domain-containing protein [Apiospora rasikravindrae]|uniref:Growth arrest and DNA-damage-inducible proteins-interacting protein 1 domain-containing protein n=1 Tax=Apiospora rasikravindrae TaxID=990691 RepID=A0ABR1RNW7_9PEZI